MKTAHHRFAVAILALLVLPNPAWGADPIKAELDAARKVYDDTVAAAKAALLKAFDDEIKKVAATGDLDRVKDLLADTKKVARGDRLPESHPLRKYQVAYIEKAFAAIKPLHMALEAGVKKYTMELEIDKATVVQSERKKLEIAAIYVLEGVVGVDKYNAVVKVYLNDTKVTDAGLVYLKGMTKLEKLDLDNTLITNVGLVYLKGLGLTGLKTLYLASTKITDAGLEHLKRLTNLNALNLSGTDVTNAGLAHLKGLTYLELLALDSTQVTDAGLVHLKELTKLQDLYVSRTKVTDAGLAHLKGMTNLEELYLDGTKVTDAGLMHLKGLTKLQIIGLRGTDVTDAGLEHLEGLKNLKMLGLEYTKVTDAAVKKLQQALPNCKIKR